MLPRAVFLRVTLPTSVPRERGLVFSCQNGILFPGVRSLLIKVTAKVMKLRRTTKRKREPKGSVPIVLKPLQRAVKRESNSGNQILTLSSEKRLFILSRM